MKFIDDDSGKVITPITLSLRSDLEPDGRVTVRRAAGEVLWGNVIIEEKPNPLDAKNPIRSQIYKDAVVLDIHTDRSGFVQLPEELKEAIQVVLRLMTKHICDTRELRITEEVER